ncbi:MAG: phosphatidate cytidylyltransferase [Pirellulales bacterium]|nr:phosphatidate cytidylyltransferase [Pirellulales bacterium]
MLRWRLLLGTLIIASLVGLCWLDHRAAMPGAWLFPVAVALTLLATGETLQLTRDAGLRPQAWIVYGANLVLVAVAWLAPPAGLLSSIPPAERGSPEAFNGGPSWLLLTFALVVLVVFAGEICRYKSPGGATANLSAAVLSTAYAGLLMALLVELRMAWGVGALAALVIVVKSGDTGAYTVGRLMGRHKLAPRLSPGKTIEGVVGGLLFACLGSWATFRWILPALMPDAANQSIGWHWAIFGVAVATAGIVGDLGESLIKRDVGRKDSSIWLPGFGGVLDILDAILLAVPIACIYWRINPFGWIG